MIQESNKAMLFGALMPTTVIGIGALIISTLVKGRSGLYGALFAQSLVLIFFLLNIAVWFLTKKAKPYLTLLFAWGLYFVKLLILGVMVYFLDKHTSNSQVSRAAFGTSAILLTFVWLIGETRAFLKLKLHLPLPTQK